ncbi:Hypothetical predicted protein [Xyrichtys novacula]|uniref:Uncharacterized protein n=1 Tax=Xyrichtys novacula TaxID=13765 RepID=A0AAV1F3G4_XYRNO|nr:Hypothetical predicted protein [Xyrichtys novacula]
MMMLLQGGVQVQRGGGERAGGLHSRQFDHLQKEDSGLIPDLRPGFEGSSEETSTSAGGDSSARWMIKLVVQLCLRTVLIGAWRFHLSSSPGLMMKE